MAWPLTARSHRLSRRSRGFSVLITLAGVLFAIADCAPETAPSPTPKSALWFIDLIDEDMAVLIDSKGALWTVSARTLPAGAREGMAFDAPDTPSGTSPDCARMRCTFDQGFVQAQIARIAGQRDRLLASDEGGPIHL